LYQRAWLADERAIILFEHAVAWLVQHKVLLPGATTLERLIVTIQERATARLWTILAAAVPPEHQPRLEALLTVPTGKRQSPLDQVRKPPVDATAVGLLAGLARLRDIRALGVSDLPLSICAVLVAEACNIGLEPLVQPDIPALTRDRLAWVQQNYIRAETLTRANTRLVAAQAPIPIAHAWGGGEVASVDGMRFVVPVRTINAGGSPKHFPRERGLT
jgi:hypothetical protein